MNATDILSHEHRAIELVLTTMEKFADHLNDGDQELDPSIAEDCLDFISGFADKCHHSKEEDALFPLLEKRGLTRNGGPIGQMLHEHDEGRNLIKSIKKNLDAWTSGNDTARADLAEAMKCYATLLRSHIFKEDQILFTAAQAALSDEDNRELIKAFDDIEETKIGPGVHERYHKMLDDLEKRCNNL